MNKKAFTLIEIIAVIIIIGIISGIGVIAVSSSTERSRKANFASLARAYAESLRAMRNKDKIAYEPKENEALVFPCSQLNGVEIENKDFTAYGDLLPEYCYTGLERYGSGYKYYISMMDTSGHFMKSVEYNEIDEDKIKTSSDMTDDYKELKAPINNFSTIYNSDTYNLKWIRVKYDATYNSGNDSKTLYGYYYIEDNPGFSSDISGTISDYNLLEQSLESGSINREINGVTYNITKSYLMYALVKK